MRLFEVGGCVRDGILGIPTKDIDFAVEMDAPALVAEKAFEKMVRALKAEGFVVFLETPEFFTMRARFPKGHVHEKLVADFVLCRKDGPTADGRRPEWVEAGSLADDLRRRDFTMNAIAKAEDGSLIDPHGGLADIEAKVVRFVGDPMERLREDGLRAMRALRFSITKGFSFAPETLEALTDERLPALLAGVSKERMREELDKMFRVDTIGSLELLTHVMRPEFLEVVFDRNLRLKPTMEA